MELLEIIEELKRASFQIINEQLDNFIKEIDSHKRIFVYGTGRTGLMLKALAMRLMQMGYCSYVIGETITPSINNGDLLIIASASGETQSVCNTADVGKKQGADILVITGSQESTLCRYHKPLVRINTATKCAGSEASIQPLGSLFEQMILLIADALILKMNRRDEKGITQMAKRHANIE